MKKVNKLIPLILSVAVITGCSSKSIEVSNGSENLVNTTKTGVTNTTYQELYDKLYASTGTTVATDEIVYQIGLDLFEKSGRSQDEWDERVRLAFNDFFNSTYMYGEKFDERMLAASLRTQGYNISCSTGTFLGTKADLVDYNNLQSSLRCDYSDYITRYLNRSIAKDFLYEEYILSQKSVYFTNKMIREVEYFYFNPLTYNVSEKFVDLFGNAVKNLGSSSFEDLVLGTNGLQDQWEAQKLDELEQDFALIDYTKSSSKYADLYKDIFDLSAHTDEVKSELSSEIKEYSNSGVQSIFTGYELKKLALQNIIYYYSKVGTDEGSTLIASDLDTKIFKEESAMLKNSNGFLLAQSGSDEVVIKGSDSQYYIIKVNIINANSSIEDKRKGAKALAKNTSNTKGAIAYYLEQYNVKVHEQSLYEYIDTTYDFEAK